MKSFHIYNLKKLARKQNDLYLTSATLGEVKEWNLQSASYQTKQEILHIYTQDIKVLKDEGSIYDLEVQDGYLVTSMPDIDLEEELPILISNSSQVSIIINALLQIEAFKKFVEIKSNKVSNNSSKIITVKTLETLASYVFDDFTLGEVADFLKDFVMYIERVISRYEFFKYYSVKHVKELKYTSIIHSTFSWYIIFKFFRENHKSQVYNYINIPKLDLDVQVGKWSGNFFEKSNPVWAQLYSGKRKFYPTKENLQTTYKIWISYL